MLCNITGLLSMPICFSLLFLCGRQLLIECGLQIQMKARTAWGKKSYENFSSNISFLRCSTRWQVCAATTIVLYSSLGRSKKGKQNGKSICTHQKKTQFLNYCAANGFDGICRFAAWISPVTKTIAVWRLHKIRRKMKNCPKNFVQTITVRLRLSPSDYRFGLGWTK